MTEYNKLVRDKIPQIIASSGEHPHTRILEHGEYLHYLEAKLDEEVAEYHRDKNIEELADILEVLFALSQEHGGKEELLRVCEKKRSERGGFSDRILLIGKD